VLAKHWPATQLIERVEDCNGDWFRGVEIVCGGFPCQDLSLAGDRRGLAGKRSGLWYEFARVVAGALPTWVVIENVPGLLSSRSGRDMGEIAGALVELGYGIAWRVLDAQGFGIPQRRRRVFIVGCRDSVERAAKVLFDGESVCRSFTPRGEVGVEIARPLLTSAARCDSRTETFVFQPRAVRCGRGMPSDIVPALNASETGLHGDSQPHVWDGFSLRRLMPVECERLQGFPDDWTVGHSDAARYRMTGNAVAVPVAKWLGVRLNRVHNEG
jgi:DNA (cytosine-5)-methyltransferase 1